MIPLLFLAGLAVCLAADVPVPDETIRVPARLLGTTIGNYKITAEMPGIAADDIELTFDDGTLRIAGEKKEQRDENERGYRLSERSYGRFERIISLPEASDHDGIEASFRNGVLSITVAKLPEAQKAPRKIAITSG